MGFRHRFVSPLLDDGDETVVGPVEWNDAIILDEGLDGQVLKRDEADLDDGLNVGILGLKGGGTASATAADARTTLSLYTKAEIDARQTAIPVTIAQGGTGATTAAVALDDAHLSVFTQEQLQGGVVLQGLQLASDASLRSPPASLIRLDPSAVIHLAGTGATRIKLNSPLQIPADTGIDTITGGMQLIHASSAGVITLAGVGATKLLFGSDLALGTNTWIRAVDGTRMLGAISPQKMWVAPDRHAQFCQGGSGSGQVTFSADVTVCNTMFGSTVAIDVSASGFRLTPADADGRLNYNRYLGELEGAVRHIWRELVALGRRAEAL